MNFPTYYSAWMQHLGLETVPNPEAQLQLPHGIQSIPASLLAYHQVAGNSPINTDHNELLGPDQLYIEDNHLLFMHENQRVVDWGIRIADLDQPDPTPFQRNNDENVWYDEPYSLSQFLVACWYWLTTGEEKEQSFFTSMPPTPHD